MPCPRGERFDDGGRVARYACEPGGARCGPGDQAPVSPPVYGEQRQARLRAFVATNPSAVEGGPDTRLVVWAGAYQPPPTPAPVEVEVVSGRLSILCSAAGPPRYRVLVPLLQREETAAARGAVEVDDGSGLVLRQVADRLALDAWALLPPGTDVRVTSAGATGGQGAGVEIYVGGDCGDVRLEGSAPGSVRVVGWHRAVRVDRPHSSVDVTLDPGSPALGALSVRTGRWAVVRVPTGGNYGAEVPVGWAVACAERLDPACGQVGPLAVGTGSGIHLQAPHGLMRITDWVEDPAAPGGVADPVGDVERALGETLPVNRRPDCYDILSPDCGWPWEGCLARSGR